MPKALLSSLFRLHPTETLSELLRGLAEKEIARHKVFKAHMKLYGKFNPKDFDESLL